MRVTVGKSILLTSLRKFASAYLLPEAAASAAVFESNELTCNKQTKNTTSKHVLSKVCVLVCVILLHTFPFDLTGRPPLNNYETKYAKQPSVVYVLFVYRKETHNLYAYVIVRADVWCNNKNNILNHHLFTTTLMGVYLNFTNSPLNLKRINHQFPVVEFET